MAQRRGFTIVELLVVIFIAGILMSIILRSTGGVQSRFAVRQAKTVFGSLHARTRAQAVELGSNVLFNVDVANDSVWITSGGATLETVRFQNEMAIDIRASQDNYSVCMTSRGFADTSCGTLGTLTWFHFQQGGQVDSLRILPLGQLLY